MIARLHNSTTVRHGVIVFGSVLITNALNYLFYMLMSRHLGVEAYGVLTSMIAADLVMLVPASVAQLIAARLAADLEARKDMPALRRLADVVTAVAAAFGVIAALIGLAARDPLAHFFNLADTTPIVLTALTLGVYHVVLLQRGLFQGAHRFNEYGTSMALEAVVKLPIALLLVGTLGASGGVLAVLISVILVLGYHMIAIARVFGPLRSSLALDRDLILRVISGVGLGQLTLMALVFYDVPLVKHFFDPRSAGLYAAAALVGRAVFAAISFVPTVVLPKATARAAAGISAFPLLAGALALAGSIVAVAAVFAFFEPRLLVTLITGAAFADAAPLVFLLVIASGMLALANIVASYRMGLHSYGFVKPGLTVAVLEFATIVAWHPSLQAIVGVLALGHATMFVVMLVGIKPTASIAAGGDLPSDAVLEG